MDTVDLGWDALVLQPTYVRLLCEVLRQKGMSIEAALQQAGLDGLAALQARQEPLSVRQVAVLIDAARSAGGDDRLALDAGALFQVSTHGALGHAVVASPNLLVALTTVAKYGSLRNLATRFVFRSGPKWGVLQVHERVDLGPIRTVVLTLLAFAISHAAAAAHAGHHALKLAQFPYSSPLWAADLADRLGCPCQFDAPALSFTWSADDLVTPNLTADSQAFGDAVRRCEAQLSALKHTPLSHQVQAFVSAREPNWPTLAQTAQHFQMSSRTLIRRLQAEGTRFQTLLDQQRAERARWYLVHTRLPIEEIAQRLGYQDSSNFSRSFRRWLQITPGQLRAGAEPTAAGAPPG